jgi:hypothetical protein
MSTSSFFNELKRRQIYRGGVMYVVAGWVIVQVATTLFPIFDIPEWSIRLVVVAVMLGFPLALVGLWMFESHASQHAPPASPAANLPHPPGAPVVERRRDGDRSSDALARLVESERVERQRTNEELLAALDRLKGTPNAAAGLAQPAPAVMPGIAPSRRPRIGGILLAVFVTILAAWGIWILVAPSAAVPGVGDASEVTNAYVVPAYQQVEQLGAALLEPLLRKLGIHIQPERVFTALMLVIALLVLRNLGRSMLANRRPRRQQPR